MNTFAQPSGRTAHRGGGASNVIAPVKFSSFFHIGENAYVER